MSLPLLHLAPPFDFFPGQKLLYRPMSPFSPLGRFVCRCFVTFLSSLHKIDNGDRGEPQTQTCTRTHRRRSARHCRVRNATVAGTRREAGIAHTCTSLHSLIWPTLDGDASARRRRTRRVDTADSALSNATASIRARAALICARCGRAGTCADLSIQIDCRTSLEVWASTARDSCGCRCVLLKRNVDKCPTLASGASL
jgi:hypothetical protein